MFDDEVKPLLDLATQAVGGEPRPGQVAMAQAVTQAIEEKTALAVQAGTGTGKSLAYLVPAVAAAVQSKSPVLIATATLSLQNQLVKRDIPRLATALTETLGREVTCQTVKGRANYVCQHRLHGGFPEEGTEESSNPLPGIVIARPQHLTQTEADVARVREWAETTRTGDRDDLVPGVSDRAWRAVSVSARECLGPNSCPHESTCFSEAARRRARHVDVVVTNHALLAIDTFEGRSILPDHEVLVVDEAHDLADRVTGVVTDLISETVVHAAAGRCRKVHEVDGSALETAASSLGAALDALEPGRFEVSRQEELLAAMSAVRDSAREVLSDLSTAAKAGGEGLAAVQFARAAVSEVHSVAERVTQCNPSDVAWLTVPDGPGERRPLLYVAPLSVAGPLHRRLFTDRAVVLTSATLTVGGSFSAVAQGWGLFRDGFLAADAPAPETVSTQGEASSSLGGPFDSASGDDDDVVWWRSLDVGSPFDYPRQGILYVAQHLTPPNSPSFTQASVDEIVRLVTASGGRTLGLFSSHRALQEATAKVREQVDVRVLCQGDDVTPTLVKEFLGDETSCLFGTLSLWQGVDVPGSTCQLVIIDKIPFPRPDDPLSSARAESVSKSGGNGFMQVAAHVAGIRLAQGVGRLIRSTGDRGVVAVLDSRLATARYGEYLRKSLPPLWPTTDPAVAISALERLTAELESTSAKV